MKSPDSKVDALIIERDCGATTSASKSIFIVPAGKKFDDEYSVFTCDKDEELSFRWEASKVGSIEYSKARIFKYQNFWASKRLDNFEYEVKITEREKSK